MSNEEQDEIEKKSEKNRKKKKKVREEGEKRDGSGGDLWPGGKRRLHERERGDRRSLGVRSSPL